MTSANEIPAVILVNTRAQLADVVARCRQATAVAVDTEFMRTDTFFPILGLVQLCAGDEVWLVDPLAIDNLGDLRELLADRSVVKILHSCSEDIEVLQRAIGEIPGPLADTQVAAAFAGYGFSRGYAALVEAVLGVILPKHETRSDWLQRPLTDSQCRYAAEDVHFLLQVYAHLRRQLIRSERWSWVEEDMQSLETEARKTADPALYYSRIKAAWRLERENLSVLRQLASWRETEARRRNKPRNRIVQDQVLVEIARTMPGDRHSLAAVSGLHPGQVRRYGDVLLGLVAAGREEADSLRPEPLSAPFSREARKLLAGCRDLVAAKSQALQVAPEVLARKRDLEALVQSILDQRVVLPPALASGWRHQQIGVELENYARQAAV